MSQMNDPEVLHRQLQQLLEAHGADRSRWPAAERLRFAPLIASNVQAKVALSEAAALDRLLDSAPTVSIERERALARRIVAAASAPPLRAGRAGSNVVALRRNPASNFATAIRHPAAALMAASLVLGIVVGSSGAISPAVTYLAELTGLSDEEPELALASDVLPSGDEAL